MAQDIEFSSEFFKPSEERSLCLLLDYPDQNPSQEGIRDDSGNEKLKLWVAKDLMAVASPVFKRMFYAGNFCESLSENKDKPIYLPGKNVNDFLEFLKCLFPLPDRKKVDQSNMHIVLPLADEYQVEMLLKKCIKCFKRAILQFGLGNEEILNDVPFFVKYRLDDLIKMVVPYAAALNSHILMKFRRDNKNQLPTDHAFYFAIYEAIANRFCCETHDQGGQVAIKCNRCYIDNTTFGCLKCGAHFCANCSSRQCVAFHTCYLHPSKARDPCICGYKFTEDLLKLI